MVPKLFSVIVFFICCYYIMSISCKSPIEPETLDLLYTQWTLESIDFEGNVIKPPKDQLYTIQFKEDSTVSGKIDCNDFYANYLIETDNSLKFEQLVRTKIGCGGDQSFSDKYFQGLREAKSYKFNKNSLDIYYGNNSRLIFIVNGSL